MDIEHKMPLGPVELEEYLFATHLERVAKRCEQEKHNVTDYALLVHEARSCMFWHRFQVMNWLMANGVKIPLELLSDQAHQPVGQQYPDQHKPA